MTLYPRLSAAQGNSSRLSLIDKQTAAYRLIKHVKENGEPLVNLPWATRMGKPPLMNDEECKEVVNDFAKHTGKSLGKKDVNDILIQVQRKRIELLGYKPICLPSQYFGG